MDLGPPPGTPERRRQRRRASDVPKPRCPWCGGCTSAVYKSKPSYVCDDRYRRRRQCADCGKDWPTKEELDVDVFRKDLAKEGLAWREGQVVKAEETTNG